MKSLWGRSLFQRLLKSLLLRSIAINSLGNSHRTAEGELLCLLLLCQATCLVQVIKSTLRKDWSGSDEMRCWQVSSGYCVMVEG